MKQLIKEVMECIVDGKAENRFVDYIERSDGSPMGDNQSRFGILPRQVPELKYGERLDWILSDDRPYISKAKEHLNEKPLNLWGEIP